MEKEIAFYSIITAIIVIGGVAIGVSYYHATSTSSPSKTTTTATPSVYNLRLVVDPNAWYHNASINQDQPAYFIVSPTGQLESTANIKLPAHTLIQLTLIDYDDYGLTPNIGPTGTSNVSKYAKVIGTVGGVEYVINSTNVNATLPTSTSTSGISIPASSTYRVSAFPWDGGANGGYDVAHTFTILNGTNIILNIPTPGQSTLFAQFYLNNTGTFEWQCFAPCGVLDNGWGGAMSTVGWMTGTVTVY